MAEGSQNTLSPITDPPAPTQPTSQPIGAPTPYIVRKIDVTFEVGEGPFGAGPGKQTVTLRGLRCSATIERAGVAAQGKCSLRIWGMAFSLMQKLSTYGQVYTAQRSFNLIVEAGDDTAGMTTVFSGIIWQAYFDGEAQPDVAFQIDALEGLTHALKPVPPVSVKGAVDVATQMQSLASQMGVTFENHGVNVKLRDIYYPGTAYQQMRRIAEHAGINATLENGTLAIWPSGSSRQTGTIPLFTRLSGMRNYPTFTSNFIVVTHLFMPLQAGGQVAVESTLWNNQRKTFTIIGYTYTLESEMPDGPWFVTFKALADPFF